MHIRKNIVFMLAHVFGSALSAMAPAAALKLPEGFVYLADVAPKVIQSIRYCSTENFVGRIVPGYKKPCAILAKEAADALAAVQKDVEKDGYNLVIYEAYRPHKASKFFVQWSQDAKDLAMKSSYYPRFTKEKIIKDGWVATQSGHSEGSSVDVSLIKIGEKLKPVERSERVLKDGAKILFLDDGSVDMGSSFDLLDEASRHDNDVLIDKKYVDLRNYLRAKMVAHGWKPFKGEWWHYALVKKPFPGKYFDFDLE